MKLRLLVRNLREGNTKIAHVKDQCEKNSFVKLQWRIEEAQFLNSFGLCMVNHGLVSKAWAIDDHENSLKPSCFIGVRMQLKWELSCCLSCELSRSRAFQKGFSSWLLTQIHTMPSLSAEMAKTGHPLVHHYQMTKTSNALLWQTINVLYQLKQNAVQVLS